MFEPLYACLVIATLSRDAAALACAFAFAARAYRGSRWFGDVRIKRNGAVLEPASAT